MRSDRAFGTGGRAPGRWYLFLLTWLLLLPVTGHTQLLSGEYVAHGGLGILSIIPDKSAGLRFHLFARGSNFHVCELSGVIRNGEARMEDSADDRQPCIVTFKPGKDGIAVDAKHQGACSMYCGARAHFQGSYALPPAGCAPSQVRRTRDRFKSAYDQKRYAEARDLLRPIIEKCASAVTEIDDGWIRNDLAITYHRAGDSTSCRAVLQPWVPLAQTPDAKIRDDYPPSDGDEMLRIAGAARANLKLCGAPVTIKPPAKP